MATVQQSPVTPFSRQERILLWTLTVLLVAGLSASSLVERGRVDTLTVIPARDAEGLATGWDQIRAARTVHVNESGAWNLERLPGIGPELAKRIIAYRKAHGPFAGPQDLLKVRGIGPAKLEQMRERIEF